MPIVGPIVRVYGLVNEMKEETLVVLYEMILGTFKAIKVLNLKEKDITVFFPQI